ncbi:MAG: MFS transporter, partial [Candidatus Saccharibacteria bacterium]|nr:MFS transporter [Candidatus Saccharibacteria bacterium]
MFQRIVSRLFRARHYWRSVSFDEIAELYVSRLMTVFAASIVSTFAVIFLYELGYSIVFIAAFFGIGYVFKIFFAIPAAQFAAYFGPKRGTLVANILRIPTLVSFALVPEYGLPAIIGFGLFQHMSNTLYNICYTTNFSKVRSLEHSGRELGIMNVLEKVAKIVSPLVGGIIATTFGPVVAIWLACIVFVLAALPLFRSMEPTRVRSRL